MKVFATSYLFLFRATGKYPGACSASGFRVGGILCCVSEYVRKSHNVSVLLYHLVCPTKYRRAVLDAQADQVLQAICLDIERRYEITFLQIGVDKDHVHFLIQSVPMFSPSRIAQVVKSLTAREMFRRLPELKKQLWGGAFWTSGYFINTVGHRGSEQVIRAYVQRQGQPPEEYKDLFTKQLTLFGDIDE